jgi:hypothetical protein
MLDGRRSMLSQDEIVAENERFFAPIGRTLIDFARRYNLFLETYYHDAPSWSLCFSPPQGGFAKLDVCQESETTVSIVGVWWVDDYDRGTRFLKWIDKVEVERQPDSVEEHLIATLKAVLASKAGEWTRVATGYGGIWSRTWTKEQFEQLQQDDKFPVPQLGSL